jgi:hypothetical protein
MPYTRKFLLIQSANDTKSVRKRTVAPDDGSAKMLISKSLQTRHRM